MPKLLRQEPGSVGQYFEGEFDDPGRRLILEVHVVVCAHCQHQVEVPSKKAMMEHVDLCYGCMRLICPGCYGQPCRPAEKEAERQEREYRLKLRIEGGGFRCD